MLCVWWSYSTDRMDFSKYPFEKLFYFAAGVIPGFVALLIFQLAAPGSFAWFFALGFLGYRAKLGLILLAAFVVGNSLTTFLSSLLGALGGALGSISVKEPYKPPHSYDTAPWRDERWRTVLKSRLGAQAPNDTSLIPPAVLKIRREMIDSLPANERPMALVNLGREKLSAEMDDGNWEQWYDHYHQVVVFEEDRKDFDLYVRRGLNFNLETAAVYVLISAVFVRSLRHWWCILPTCMWVLLLVAQEYSGFKRYTNKWSSLSAQIKYLSEDRRSEEASGADSGTN